MQENTLSSNLTRIKDATDSIRAIVNEATAPIEDVADAVSDLNDEKINLENDLADAQAVIDDKDAEILELEQEIEEITPKGIININTNNDSLDIAQYAYANVKVQDPNIKGVRFSDWIGDDDNILIFNSEEMSVTELLNQYDTSQFTSGRYMFNGCTLDSNDLGNLNTSNMVRMNNMFDNTRPRSNDTFIANFDFTNVTDVNSMFTNSEYRIIDLTALNKTINGMNSICSGCSNLVACYVPNLNVTGNFHRFFQNDSNLQFVDIRSMEFHTKTNDGGLIFTNVPDNCWIVVKDQTEKNWILN